jgi:hypothetical protein
MHLYFKRLLKTPAASFAGIESRNVAVESSVALAARYRTKGSS